MEKYFTDRLFVLDRNLSLEQIANGYAFSVKGMKWAERKCKKHFGKSGKWHSCFLHFYMFIWTNFAGMANAYKSKFKNLTQCLEKRRRILKKYLK